MQKRHTDRESYFDEQSQTSKNYYIPYIKEVIGHIPDKVLEVGCGEGGNLLPFAKADCRVMGVVIDDSYPVPVALMFKPPVCSGKRLKTAADVIS